MKPSDKVRYIGKREVDARRSSAGRGATAGNGQLAEAPANDSGDSQRSQQTTQFASAKRFAASILLALLLCGCAARKPTIRPGHDIEHPPLKIAGKGACHVGILKLFGSYGWHNCKNEEPVLRRIAWRSKLTGKEGHGDWMPWTETQAASVLVEATASTPELWHWVETKP